MWKNRNYLKLMIGQLISTFGNNLFSIALPWFVYATTHSKADLAIVGVAGALPMLVGLLSGVLVDRWPKLRTMIQSDVLRMFLCVVMAILAMTDKALWPIVLLVFLLQIAGSFFSPAAGALVPMIVEQDQIPTAVGVEQSSSATAQLVGTLSGGILMSTLGAALLFVGDAITFLFSVISLLLMRVREERTSQPANKSGGRFAREFLQGLGMFRKSRFLLLTLFAALLVNFAMSPFDLVLTAWIKGPLHGTATDLGIINAAFFLGIVIGGVLLNQWVSWLSIRTIFLISLSVAGGTVLCIGLLPNIAYDSLLAMCMGFVIGTLNGAFMTIATKYIPADMRGRAFGTIGALFSMATPLGIAVSGVLMTHLSLKDVFLWMGILGITAGFLFLLPIREDLALAFVDDGQIPVSSGTL